MGKINYKKDMDDCSYRIFPLGKGLPLCLYNVVKAGKRDVKIQDLSMCKYKGYCFKEKTEEKKKDV